MAVKTKKPQTPLDDTRVTKKLKTPQVQEKQTQQPEQNENNNREIPRDRLISCPDEQHHLESEILNLLVKYFTNKYGYVVEGEDETSTLLNQLSINGNNNNNNVVPCEEGKLEKSKIFEGRSKPKISVNDYLQRLVYYLTGIAEFERKTNDPGVHSDLAVRYLLAVIIYLERLPFKTNSKNVHRLLITGCLVSSKILDDFQPEQQYFADLGGVSKLELSELEWAFCELLDWKVQILPEEFLVKYQELLGRHSESITEENLN